MAGPESDDPGSMLLISGPSGCGKSTICQRLMQDPRVVFSVSATTRSPRGDEVDGVHYHFLSPADFRARVRAVPRAVSVPSSPQLSRISRTLPNAE